MAWDVEYTDEFRAWWDTLTESQQDDVAAAVQLLMDDGPQLRFPHSSGVEGSKSDHTTLVHWQRVQTRSPVVFGASSV